MKRVFWLVWLLIVGVGGVRAQEMNRENTTRSLAEMLSRCEEQFGVEITCRRLAADTLWIPWAEQRLRPYSLEESLENLCRPLDLKWSKRGEGRYRVEPYEYYRRTPAEGAALLSWLEEQYADRVTWEQRRDTLLKEVRSLLAMETLEAELVAEPDIRLGEVRSWEGYTTQNYLLETLPGVYVGGTIYAPISCEGRLPLILSPAGHWPGGRLRPDQQYRMATFARMGAVAVDLDIVGWGRHAETVPFPHEDPRSMRLQALWTTRVADWVIEHRGDIDLDRLAATGGSGGATHTLLLALLDPRFRVLAPVAHLVSHFDGGCPCESGVPITGVAGGSCLPELLAAAVAPNPLLVVSDGGDWTASYPTLEYPYLQRIWGFYGESEQVRLCHLPDERHDYGIQKREAVYAFLAEVLGLNLEAVDESRVTLLSPEELELPR